MVGLTADVIESSSDMKDQHYNIEVPDTVDTHSSAAQDSAQHQRLVIKAPSTLVHILNNFLL